MIPHGHSLPAEDGRTKGPDARATVIRARTVLTLAGERVSRGMDALTAPLTAVADGVITARNGVIEAVEPYAAWKRRHGRSGGLPHDMGDVVLAPGLINCHTHLELSHMYGKTVLGKGFHAWVSSLIPLDGATRPEEARAAMDATMAAMAAGGTAAVGDISSRMPRDALATARKNGLAPRLFMEFFGQDPERVEPFIQKRPDDPAVSLAGHALYSTSGHAMVLAKNWCDTQGLPFSMHLSEHADEVECLQTGTGLLADLLRQRVLPHAWRAPGMRPVRYAASLGLLSPSTLAVHCVHCDARDIRALRESGTAICLCPRSNAAINVGEAPARAFAEQGVPLVLGTDSLASNDDCHVWKEAEYFLKKNTLPGNALLRMATVNGATVLGFGKRLGTLERGKAFCYTVFSSEMSSLFL